MKKVTVKISRNNELVINEKVKDVIDVIIDDVMVLAEVIV